MHVLANGAGRNLRSTITNHLNYKNMNKFLNSKNEQYIFQPGHNYIYVCFMVEVRTNGNYRAEKYFGDNFMGAWKYYNEQRQLNNREVSLWDCSSFRGNLAGYPVPRMEKKRIA